MRRKKVQVKTTRKVSQPVSTFLPFQLQTQVSPEAMGAFLRLCAAKQERQAVVLREIVIRALRAPEYQELINSVPPIELPSSNAYGSRPAVIRGGGSEK